MTSPRREPRFITESLGGSGLSRLAQNGDAPPSWYVARPSSVDEWRARAQDVRRDARPDWWEAIGAAGSPRHQARERLTRCVAEQGVAVTTGQQPGLFGGPVYTWAKAISALALADQIEESTGIPTVPIFWAATDDTDFVESATTWVAVPGGAEQLTLSQAPHEGTRLRDAALADVAPLLTALQRACGSAPDSRALDSVQRAYHPGATIGGAYVTLLRDLLEPLGIVVLDAGHAAISQAAHAVLRGALLSRDRVAEALRARTAELRTNGFEPQVVDLEGRTLVFELVGQVRTRVTRDHAVAVASKAVPGTLSPNVLLRPIVERCLMPTLAYLAGPGELAYFAQVSAVADAMELARPLAVPRWSVTIVEPHVDDLLDRYRLSVSDLADPHAAETRLARAAWPQAAQEEFLKWRHMVAAQAEAVRDTFIASAPGAIHPQVFEGAARSLTWRLDRLGRRITAAVKRHESSMMQDLGSARGSLYPGGVRQERALNLTPLLSRYGIELLDLMRAEARPYAQALVRGASSVTAAG